MKPRILFNDKNLIRADADLLSLIISLTLKKDYCFATNKYLVDYINTSERTISYSLSKFKKLNYAFVKKVNGQRSLIKKRYRQRLQMIEQQIAVVRVQ